MQPLLLLHGAIGSKAQFDAFARLKEKFVVHTMNFSGHGGRDFADEFTIEKFADDVLDYLSQHNLTSVNIFGYSMGGYVALYLAKHHPEKVNAAFTFATKFNWTPEVAEHQTKLQNAEKIEEKIPDFARQLEQLHFPTSWKLVLKKTSDMMSQLGRQNPLSVEDLNNIKQKVLIGIGDKDTMVTLEETITAYRNLPNSNLIVFPETPHAFEKLKHEKLISEITCFFNE
jgi:pimeloyl-ACP methyl ester carboxylesterase